MHRQIQNNRDQLLEQIDQTEAEVQLALELDETGKPTLHLFLSDGDESENDNAIESSISTPQLADHDTQSPQDRAQLTKRAHTLSLWPRVLACFALFVWLAPALMIPVGSPVFLPPVTVLITPVTKLIELQTSLTLPARPLQTPTLSSSKTMRTTGKGYQPASVSSGIVTLYNALPSPQFIPAGTIITASNGLQIATSQGTTIPGAQAPTMGEASIAAHTLATGHTANIAPLDINGPCCMPFVLAKNTTPFTGGIDERRFSAVAQEDIEQAANALHRTLQDNANALLSAQLQSNEALIDPLCSTKITSDHTIGDEASKVTVSVELQCTDSAYQTTVLQHTLEQRLDQVTGGGFKRISIVQYKLLKVKKITQENRVNQVSIDTKSSAHYVYQFTKEKLEDFKHKITGKSREEALSLLHTQPGVNSVSMNIEDDAFLPLTHSSITILLLDE